MAATSAGNFGVVNKRVNDDLNPRRDYGLATFDNRHAFSAGGNWNAWRDFGIGATYRYYSGNPVNETVGTDRNGDRDAANFDRPVKGRDDLTRPIVSKLDSTGTAIRNGIKGTDKMLLDLRLQYVHRISGERTGRRVLGNLQCPEPRQLRQPDRRTQQRRFPAVDHRHVARSMQIGLRLTHSETGRRAASRRLRLRGVI